MNTRPVTRSRTYCDGLAMAVAARGLKGVGVDLERRRPIPDAHLRFFLTPRERRELSVAPIVCWVMKEAAWKALQLDDATPFSALELSWKDGLPVAAMVRGELVPLEATVFEPWPGYIGAVVALLGVT